MATIKDVAEKCGVGTTTISRVINNSSSVSVATRKKVLKAMQELNYQPNLTARALAGDRTYTVALVMDNTVDKTYANPFIYEIFRGIEKVIYENGYNLLLVGKNTYQHGKLAIESILQGKTVDGAILPRNFVMEKTSELLKYDLPIVSLGALDQELSVSSIDIDNFIAGYKAAEYLYSRGYRRLAFSEINFSSDLETKRYSGYEAFVQSKNLPSTIFNGDFQHTDSIICINNLSAFRTLQFCKKHCKRIPEDIGLITFDNYPLAEFVEPSLTNIEIDLCELGRQTALEILRLIKDRSLDNKKTLLPVSINVGKSTK